MTDERHATNPTDDVVSVGGRYYVRVSAGMGDDIDRVLKHNESFGVFDRFGDIRQLGLADEGMYHNGTRHLSRLTLRVGSERPLILGSTARMDNSRLSVDLTNPELQGAPPTTANTVHIARSKVLVDAVCYEHLVLRNFAEELVRLPVSLAFEADFVDIFQVRGLQRSHAGEVRPARVGDSWVELAYLGADGVHRTTRIDLQPVPTRLDHDEALWEIELAPDESTTIDITIACSTADERIGRVSYDAAADRAREHLRSVGGSAARLTASSERFDDWVARSFSDVAMMTSATSTGPYPYAGVPWFSTPFGRDGLITALQCLWLAPELAIGVLRFLAATQAEVDDPSSDAQPGKIVHEIRRGEMAATGEVPFGRYYGSQDATPLFLMLLHDTWRRTGDLALVRELWPNARRALDWLDSAADIDGDGFAEYERRAENGLLQQGWKDSSDSISHADGTLASGPIALVEVQAYAYAARRGTSAMASALGDLDAARQMADAAEALKQRFEESFWDEEMGIYVLALDGSKRPCRVVSSNAGHALFTGIASPERAARVAATLMAPRSFSGWGVRTLAAGERRYNPMSYHNGSIWPHDNAIVAAGFARYGYHQEAAAILRGMSEASTHFDLYRLPELFCGFTRREDEGPTRYPVACSPQAWAAGAVFMLLAASLGLKIDGIEQRVQVGPGQLPAELDWLKVDGLTVADASLDISVTNQGDGLGVDVRRRSASLDVVVRK